MSLKFEEWGQHILAELERQHRDHLDVRKDLAEIKLQLVTLKVKSGMWGATAGIVPLLAVLLWRLL